MVKDKRGALAERLRISGLLLALALAPVGWGLSTAAAARGEAPAVPLEALSPTPDQVRTTRLVVDLLRRFHYRKFSLDDELSSEIYDRYLRALDPSRNLFLRADIEALESYRHRLDDILRSAELEIPFRIFKAFRARMTERARYAQRLLEGRFDFTVPERYQFDRSEASWPATEAERDELWRKRVKNDFLELRLAGRSDEEIRETLRKRYQRMERRARQLDRADVFQLFMNAFGGAIEPHTSYFSPRTSENFRIRMSLSLEGIGAALQTENEYTVVRRIIAGGPAARSKQLQVNDRIVGVGQGLRGEMVDVVSWRLEDVVDLIRGPKNSVVRLQVLPGDAPAGSPPRTITLVRDTINLEERAAKRSVIELEVDGRKQRFGVIDVPTFYLDSAGRARGLANYRSTTRDVRRLLGELEREGVAGIIIDLRGNSGGSLIEATELSGLFIRSGPIVQIKDSSGRLQLNEDPDPGLAYDGPLAVLVDRYSASASEIFAGAIQDYRRGVIIGEPTFGKGTVQNLFDLERYRGQGQLKATIAQFFRVAGASTQHRGVVPDIEFPTAARSEDEGERSLENALPWASVRPADYRPWPPLEEAIAIARERFEARSQSDPRFALLLEELALERAIRATKSLSLVESERKREFEQRRAEQRALSARFRELMGLPPEAPGKSGAAEEGSGDGGPVPSTDPEDPRSDLLLREAARILYDVIRYGSERARLAALS